MAITESAEGWSDAVMRENEHETTGEHFLYLITGRRSCGQRSCGRRHWYKIGFSGDPDRRRRELMTGLPEKLEILGTWELPTAAHTSWLEAHLHAVYGLSRGSGEWFCFDEFDLADCLKRISTIQSELLKYSDAALASDSTRSIPGKGITLHELSQDFEGAIGDLDFGGIIDAVRVRDDLKNQLAVVKCDLIAASEGHSGIQGVLTLNTILGKSRLKYRTIRNEYPELVAKHQTEHVLPSFRFHEGFRLREEDGDLVKRRLRQIRYKSRSKKKLERTPRTEGLHCRYLHLTSEAAVNDVILYFAGLKLRPLLGDAECLSGVCSYTRQPSVNWRELEEEARFSENYYSREYEWVDATIRRSRMYALGGQSEHSQSDRE